MKIPYFLFYLPSLKFICLVLYICVRWVMNGVGAYHLTKKSGNFDLKSNGRVIFPKFRSEIVEYLQRYSSFSIRNRTVEDSLPFE